ncbi:MAG TPA: MFS transporter [Candidatus Saccharimonadales bacterium]|nr:MFS transporter [Candidatus Saccharimonadales bacterium]
MRRFYDLSTFRSLRHRNFRLLVEGNVISTSGDFMQSIAQSWLVWQLTRSPFLLGLVSFFDTVPRLFFGAISGAVADRFDRRRVLMITQTLAMIQAIVYCLAVYFKVIVFWHIAVLAFLLGCIDTLNQTVRQSLVNGMVPKEELLNAIGLQSSFFNLSKILGPSAGGAIIALVGISGCFFLNALSFMALIWNLYLMKLPTWEAPTNKQGVWKEIKEGYRYLRGNRRIFSIVSLSYVVALVGAPYSRFLPMFATNILRVGPTGFGLLMSAPGVGAIVSALSLASTKSFRPGILWICSCVTGFGLFLGLFTFSHSFIFSFVFLALVGACQVAGRAASNTAIQVETPPHLLGRVLSLFFMDIGLWSLGGLAIGSAAAIIGIDHTLAVSAGICMIAALGLLATSSGQTPTPAEITDVSL